MRALQIASIFFLLAGILTIVFSKQLAILREGPAYSMSDLGFVVYGMMAIGIGILCLVILIGMRIARRTRKTL